MKKRLLLIFSMCFLTSCSSPDTQCWYCREPIYSEDAHTVEEEYACEDCYFEAFTCKHCSNKAINSYYINYGYCDPCVENGDVLYCYLCDNFKDHDLVEVQPYINGSYSLENICHDCLYEYYGLSYEYNYDYTWGDLIEANNGELEYDTLTDEQQELVKYPALDFNKVYYVPSGKSYHSVDWCYTLRNSKTINHCTYDMTSFFGLEPCSKCVGH